MIHCSKNYNSLNNPQILNLIFELNVINVLFFQNFLRNILWNR